MEWNDGTFTPQKPERPPTITVSAQIVRQSHEKFGKTTSFPLQRTGINAISDSGCQTCTAGPEILRKLNCPPSYLVKTRHNIVGITESPLDIIGVLFLDIQLNTKTTKQMVYISKNCRGFFLSQTAMKDLHIIPNSFPQQTSSAFTSIECEAVPAQKGRTHRADHNTCRSNPRQTTSPNSKDGCSKNSHLPPSTSVRINPYLK